jgi:hypothetical protein
VKWSVVLRADGDRLVTREEVVELADAVAGSDGIASGIGTTTYAAQLIVEADSREAALDLAMTQFARAASTAGLPEWPAGAVELVGEDDDDVDYA